MLPGSAGRLEERRLNRSKRIIALPTQGLHSCFSLGFARSSSMSKPMKILSPLPHRRPPEAKRPVLAGRGNHSCVANVRGYEGRENWVKANAGASKGGGDFVVRPQRQMCRMGDSSRGAVLLTGPAVGRIWPLFCVPLFPVVTEYTMKHDKASNETFDNCITLRGS